MLRDSFKAWPSASSLAKSSTEQQELFLSEDNNGDRVAIIFDQGNELGASESVCLMTGSDVVDAAFKFIALLPLTLVHEKDRLSQRKFLPDSSRCFSLGFFAHNLVSRSKKSQTGRGTR
jgi:hypothetical protein